MHTILFVFSVNELPSVRIYCIEHVKFFGYISNNGVKIEQQLWAI
jgi:hypothetical protein